MPAGNSPSSIFHRDGGLCCERGQWGRSSGKMGMGAHIPGEYQHVCQREVQGERREEKRGQRSAVNGEMS